MFDLCYQNMPTIAQIYGAMRCDAIRYTFIVPMRKCLCLRSDYSCYLDFCTKT